MKHGTRTLLTATALLALLSACQQAESPTEAVDDAAAADSQSAKDAALSQAERDYAVALEGCEALAGDEQTACRQEALSMLEAARQAAEFPPGPS
ncbi:MAG TPA: hypothetical protein VFR29_05500 [Steroidobacteraceae bacterium]|nr:hypothetical protein [Steroidobacteraceae bacterium]